MRSGGKRLLIVEDDQHFRQTLVLEFSERGYVVQGVGSLKAYLALPDRCFDFAVVDLKLNAESGLDVLEALLAHHPACRTLILTGYSSIATAVKAIKLGAHDYLTKPATVAHIEQALFGGDAAGPARPAEVRIAEAPPSLARNEHEYIASVLHQVGGNISEAARRLGLHRQSLQRKLKKYPPKK